MRWLGIAAAAAILLSAPARADIVVNISKAQQVMTVSIDGSHAYTWPISTGRDGYDTPSGNFHAIRLERVYYSKKFDDAPMPNSVFFYGGYAIHGTYEERKLGMPASHGCVRLARANAATLYALVQERGMSRVHINIGEGYASARYEERPRRAPVVERSFSAATRSYAPSSYDRYQRYERYDRSGRDDRRTPPRRNAVREIRYGSGFDPYDKIPPRLRKGLGAYNQALDEPRLAADLPAQGRTSERHDPPPRYGNGPPPQGGFSERRDVWGDPQRNGAAPPPPRNGTANPPPPPRYSDRHPPPRHNAAPPPRDYRGSPPRHAAAPPPPRQRYADRGPPPRDYRGPPPRDRYDPRDRNPPPRYSDRREPPRDYRGPPPRDYREPLPRDRYAERESPPRDYRGAPPPRDRYADRGPPPRDYRGAPPPRDRYADRGPPSRDYRGAPPPRDRYADRGPPSRDYRGPPPRGYADRGPPPGRYITESELRDFARRNGLRW